MTSIAFIVGLTPLVGTHGASEIGCRGVSTPVVVGERGHDLPDALRRVSNFPGKDAKKSMVMATCHAS